MPVAVHCRGCGAPVPDTAGHCCLCKCPNPALTASHVAPASAPPIPCAQSIFPTALVWTVLAAVSLMFAAAAAAGVALALSL